MHIIFLREETQVLLHFRKNFSYGGNSTPDTSDGNFSFMVARKQPHWTSVNTDFF